MFNREYIFRRSIFYCHVSLPDGIFCHSEGWLWFPTELLLRFLMTAVVVDHIMTKARPPMIWKSAKSRCQMSHILESLEKHPGSEKKPFAPGGPWKKMDGKGRWSVLSFWNRGELYMLNFQGVLKMVCAALFLRFCKKIPTWLNQNPKFSCLKKCLKKNDDRFVVDWHHECQTPSTSTQGVLVPVSQDPSISISGSNRIIAAHLHRTIAVRSLWEAKYEC